MKQIIDIPDELFNIFKKHGIMAFDYFDEYDKDQIAIAITHGTPYNPSGDAISREALGKSMRKSINERYKHWDKPITVADIATLIFDEIDNAPPVEPERPQGEWENDSDNLPICNKCGEIALQRIFVKMPHLIQDVRMVRSNYCPNCGANMQKGGAE